MNNIKSVKCEYAKKFLGTCLKSSVSTTEFILTKGNFRIALRPENN